MTKLDFRDGNAVPAAQDATAVAFPGALVLIDSAGERLAAYDGAAGDIWRLRGDGFTADEIAGILAQAHGIDAVAALGDVTRVIAQWGESGLLAGSLSEACPPPAPAVRPVERDVAPLWAVYDVAGCRVRITASDPDVVDQLGATLRAFLADIEGAFHAIDVDTSEGPDHFVLRLDGEERFRVATPPEAVGAVFQMLLTLVYPGPDWLALIHGAAVVAPSGGAIVFPAEGGSGKSTLAAYLSQRGYGFLADDMIPLRQPDGHVAHWPLPHSIKRGSWPVLTPWFPELDSAPVERVYNREIKFIPASVDGRLRAAAPLGAIVFPAYSPLSAPALTALSPAEALGRMLANRLWLGSPIQPARAEKFLKLIAETPAYTLTYPSLEEAERLLRAAIG